MGDSSWEGKEKWENIAMLMGYIFLAGWAILPEYLVYYSIICLPVIVGSLIYYSIYDLFLYKEINGITWFDVNIKWTKSIGQRSVIGVKKKETLVLTKPTKIDKKSWEATKEQIVSMILQKFDKDAKLEMEYKKRGLSGSMWSRIKAYFTEDDEPKKKSKPKDGKDPKDPKDPKDAGNPTPSNAENTDDKTKKIDSGKATDTTKKIDKAPAKTLLKKIIPNEFSLSFDKLNEVINNEDDRFDINLYATMIRAFEPVPINTEITNEESFQRFVLITTKPYADNFNFDQMNGVPIRGSAMTAGAEVSTWLCIDNFNNQIPVFYCDYAETQSTAKMDHVVRSDSEGNSAGESKQIITLDSSAITDPKTESKADVKAEKNSELQFLNSLELMRLKFEVCKQIIMHYQHEMKFDTNDKERLLDDYDKLYAKFMKLQKQYKVQVREPLKSPLLKNTNDGSMKVAKSVYYSLIGWSALSIIIIGVLLGVFL